jgi:hypothetical protein
MDRRRPLVIANEATSPARLYPLSRPLVASNSFWNGK